ncbi:MAG TPA: MbtH family NRPS accessory protein [Legionella sp.]|nr:MbtH family NRPS accessory protein [Legionella sp.]
MSDEHMIVLVNAKGQYSLWETGKAIPLGWESLGPAGHKDYIEEVWTDMRPANLQATKKD